MFEVSIESVILGLRLKRRSAHIKRKIAHIVIVLLAILLALVAIYEPKIGIKGWLGLMFYPAIIYGMFLLLFRHQIRRATKKLHALAIYDEND